MGRRIFTFDWLILLSVFALVLCGLFTLLTIDTKLFSQQTLLLFVSLAVFFVLSQIDAYLYLWGAYGLFILSIGLLGAAYLGPEIRGATRWIPIAGFQLQPSEIAKPFMILVLSVLLQKFPARSLKNLPLIAVVFLIPFVLVFEQPDLGSSLVYLAVFLAMLIASGLDLRLLAITAVCFIFLLPVVWGKLEGYQQMRVLSFANPMLDPRGSGYNALQSTIAVGSGQLMGRGLGMGTQSHLRFLPEHHTDFIFASFIEELGFLGGVVLLIAYFVLLWRILGLTWKAASSRCSVYFGTGIFAMILTQVFINAGMNMSILPITGITLPFVSYGGSSLLSLSIAFGLFVSLLKMKESHSIENISSTVIQ